MDTEAKKYLRSLGLSWITVFEALSDDLHDQTIALLQENPKITKKELLDKLGIDEVIV